MSRLLQRRVTRRQRSRELLLALDHATQTGPPTTIWDLAEQAGRWPGAYTAALDRLRDTGLVERDGDYLYTTASGRAAAAALRHLLRPDA